jgi:hypothetical protein
MSAKIDLKVTGIRGRNPSWSENKGEVITFIDDNRVNYISTDAFEGFGENYKRRETSLITVCFEGKQWKGSITELATLLSLNK